MTLKEKYQSEQGQYLKPTIEAEAEAETIEGFLYLDPNSTMFLTIVEMLV